MKTNPEDLKLLNAALADESWQSFQSYLCAQTTDALRSSRRRRLALSYTLQLAAVILVIATVWSTFSQRSRTLSPRQTQPQLQVNSEAPTISASASNPSYITQDQMLAMFPKDTCVFAEINGQPELVFFDPAHARNGFDLASN
jgi:predicted PurR-regulated permease PerM